MSQANSLSFSPKAMITADKYRKIHNSKLRGRTQGLPFVSIVVLNWNGEAVIRSSLESIRRLDYPRKEVIVVDNGSTDMSKQIIKTEFPDFRLVESDTNLGFSAGMNLGMKASRGDLILLFNNDATAHPRSLSELVKTAMSNERIGIVGPLILYFKPNDVIWSMGGKLDMATGTIWSDGLGKRVSAGSSEIETRITNIDYLSGCVLLTKRQVLDKIGLLDERSVIGGQDVDWCLKARRAGFECVLNSVAVVWHVGSHSSRQMPLWSYTQRLESDFRLMLLHFPLVALIPSLAFQLLVAPFFELAFLGQSDIPFPSLVKARIGGFRTNLKNFSELLALRKQIAALGRLRLRIRTMELFEFAVFRMRSKEYYMGKFLQREK